MSEVIRYLRLNLIRFQAAIQHTVGYVAAQGPTLPRVRHVFAAFYSI